MTKMVNGHLGILLTARCNLSCSHCLQPEHFSQDLELDLCLRILREAAALGVRRVSFSGGEPTLYPNLVQIVSAARDAGLQYSLTTNGLALKPLLRAAQAHFPAHITVSIDGADARSHDAVRGSGTFSRTARNLKLLTSTGINLRIQVTLVRPMIDRINDLPRLAESLGVHELVLVLPIPTEKLATEDRVPSISDLLAARNWITKWNLQSRTQSVRTTLALGHKILMDPDIEFEQPSCKYLHGQEIFVDWNGRLGLCCQMSTVGNTLTEVICDLHKTTLKEALVRRASWLANFKRVRSLHPSIYACLTCVTSLKKSYIETSGRSVVHFSKASA